MSHTPEPWRVELKNVPLGDTGDYEGVVEIFSGDAKRPIIQFWDESEEAEANARRIVSAVNACAGISTELLECPGGNVAKVAGMLTQQRDKLLAALERCKFDSLNMSLDDLAFCRQAIAEAKGEK